MVKDLAKGSYGVDLLAITAIAATVMVGECWAALVICLMLTGGEALEDFAAHRAKKELSALLKNAPRYAHRLLADGSIEDVPLDEVQVGDSIAVRPSGTVGVDGLLLSDYASLGESSLTGESLPVDYCCPRCFSGRYEPCF